MSIGRRPTAAELDLWRRATADVEPLDRIPLEAPASEPTATPKAAKTANSPTPTPKATTGAQKPRVRAAGRAGPVDIDRRSWERLKRGQIQIERKLDLHGRTQTEAHEALDRFLTMASAAGLRCVLVVTGKGSADGRGVLRQMVPRWLDEPGHRDRVLAHAPAHRRHGGDGALYVLMRRRRSGDG